METNQEDGEPRPLTRTDWIRFGALKVQASSRRIWQIVAIIAIAGLIAVVVTDALLYMQREIQFERLNYEKQILATRNNTLITKLGSLDAAIKKYSQMANMTRTEKDQLTVEKGILSAQIDFLVNEIESLKAKIQDNQVDPGQSQEQSQEPSMAPSMDTTKQAGKVAVME